MRITGGEFCGRILKVPESDAIRPSQDRVRQALFNIIGCEVPGCAFLDLFAGSGAVGLEAISRGAASATFVEANRRHAAVINQNLNLLCSHHSSDFASQSDLRSVDISPSTFTFSPIVADAYRWIASYSGPGFDIAFADPPYALGEERGYASVLATLAERGVVKPGGMFIAEMTAVQKAEETPGWDLLRDRTYGKTRICIWRRGLSE